MVRGPRRRAELRKAVALFWTTRAEQGKEQGSKTGSNDTGSRSMVTGGKQMDGFVSLFAQIIESEGIAADAIDISATPPTNADTSSSVLDS